MTDYDFDSAPVKWLRRLITFPVFFTLWLLVTAGMPFWLICTLLLDSFSGNARFPKTRCIVFFALFLNCEIIGLIASFGVWLAALLFGIGRRQYRSWNQRLQILWTQGLLYGAMKIFSMELSVNGLDQIPPGPILLLARHASTADTVLPTVLVTARHDMRLRFVLKKELLWDPCLDVVGHRMPNVFIDRSGEQTARELAAIRKMVETTGPREGILIYPEGTRFSETKRQRYVRRITTRGPADLAQIAARFRHVLPPRPGGVLTAAGSAPEASIVLCMHTGLEGSANFQEFWNGGLIGTTIQVEFRRTEAKEIPRDPDLFLRWLFERWLEIDEWIDERKRIKNKTTEPSPGVEN